MISRRMLAAACAMLGVGAGKPGAAMAKPHREGRGALRRRRRHRHHGARHRRPARQGARSEFHHREQARGRRRHRRRLRGQFAAGRLHAAVRRQHAVHRAADRAEGELRAAEGPRAGQHHRHQRHGDGGAEGCAVLDAAASSSIMRARTPARSPIRAAARRQTIICPPPISPAKKSSTWCTCRSAAARPRCGRALEVGGHAFRQFVRPYRAGEERYRESPCRVDAASACRNCPTFRRWRKPSRASNTSHGTATRYGRRAGGGENRLAQALQPITRDPKSSSCSQTLASMLSARRRRRPRRASARICRFSRRLVDLAGVRLKVVAGARSGSAKQNGRDIASSEGRASRSPMARLYFDLC